MININEILTAVKPYALGWIYSYLTDGGLDKLGIGIAAGSTWELNLLGDASLDGNVTINESGAAKIFRVEGDTNPYLLHVVGSTDKVGIGGAADATKVLKVTGDEWVTASLQVDGAAYIGDSANANMTLGLTINQGAADDELLAGKSSDVAHGMTDVAETDTFVRLLKVSSTGGGAFLDGFNETTTGLLLRGCGVTDNTTKSTSGAGYVDIRAGKKSSAAVGAAGADANLVVIRNYTTTRFIFDAEGSAHADVEWASFDDYDDLAMLSDLETAMKDPVKAGFAEFLQYNHEALEKAGIVHFDREAPGHAMLNTTRLSMLLTGALRQLGGRVGKLEGLVGKEQLTTEPGREYSPTEITEKSVF